jgi:hypothetical protein
MLAKQGVGKVNFDHCATRFSAILCNPNHGTRCNPQKEDAPRSSEPRGASRLPGEEPVWGKAEKSRNSGASEDAPKNFYAAF